MFKLDHFLKRSSSCQSYLEIIIINQIVVEDITEQNKSYTKWSHY